MITFISDHSRCSFHWIIRVSQIDLFLPPADLQHVWCLDVKVKSATLNVRQRVAADRHVGSKPPGSRPHQTSLSPFSRGHVRRCVQEALNEILQSDAPLFPNLVVCVV